MKLADLRRIVGGMTKAPWSVDEIETEIGGDLNHEDGPVHIANVTGESMTADPHGIAALRNHADALLDLVAAADAVLATSDPHSESTAVREMRTARGRLEVVE